MIGLMTQPKDDSYPTRSSLLHRVKDTADQQSWQEFNDVYGKLILGFALKAGLTEEEAKDVVQETLIAAAKNLPEFRYDPKACSFKTWLLNLSNWRVKDQLRKRQAPAAPQPAGRARGDEADGTRTATIERVADPAGDPLEAIWDKEWHATLRSRDLCATLGDGFYVFIETDVLAAEPLREPLEKVDVQALLEQVAYCAHGWRKVPDIGLLDRRSDDDQGWSVVLRRVIAETPIRT